MVKSNVLHSVNYPRSVRRNNFTVGLTDGSIVTIVDFVVVKFSNDERVTVAFAKNIVSGNHWFGETANVVTAVSTSRLWQGMKRT